MIMIKTNQHRYNLITVVSVVYDDLFRYQPFVSTFTAKLTITVDSIPIMEHV